jgi:hypothetical protein
MMPRLADLQERAPGRIHQVTVEGDELLILDVRGQMTPAEMVDLKFCQLLESQTRTTRIQTEEAVPESDALPD